MTDLIHLETQIKETFAALNIETKVHFNELTVEVSKENLRELCLGLRDNPIFHFHMLMDICGVDYLHYGLSEWETHETTTTGFSRGVEKHSERVLAWNKPRFAVVYQLLSMHHNHRVRVRTFVAQEPLLIPSVTDIWDSANWFEREAFDLFGIIFTGHPDLRRILTDYGFVGYPFRKDFPLIGNVEARYDAGEQRVIYEPVSIEPRVLVPKVIRLDNRYTDEQPSDAQEEGKS